MFIDVKRVDRYLSEILQGHEDLKRKERAE